MMREDVESVESPLEFAKLKLGKGVVVVTANEILEGILLVA